MDIVVWAFVPVAGMLIAGTVAVLIVAIALGDVPTDERAAVLRAVATVVRSLRGRR